MKVKSLYMMMRCKSLLFFLPLFLSLPAVAFAYSDGIAVKVNAEVITFSEIEEKLGKELIRNSVSRDDAENVKKIRTDLVNKTIEGLLIKDAAITKEIVIDDKEVDKAINNIKEKNGISDEVFDLMLKNQGVTKEEYREQIRDQILSSRITNDEVNSKILIQDADIKAYYDAHKEEFKTDEEIEVEHILLLLKQDASVYTEEEVKRKILDIRDKILKGASFEEMAETYSEDPSKGTTGSIGFIKRGVTVPPFEKVAFELPVGQISEPVRTSFGLHLIKVLAIKPRNILSFEEAAPMVKNTLFQNAFDKRFNEWMAKLRKEAFLEFSGEISKLINPIGDQKTFEAVGAYKYPISRKERERIGKKNYLSVEEKREMAKKAISEKQDVDLKPDLLEKVKFYKYLLDRGLISKQEYLKKLNTIDLN